MYGSKKPTGPAPLKVPRYELKRTLEQRRLDAELREAQAEIDRLHAQRGRWPGILGAAERLIFGDD